MMSDYQLVYETSQDQCLIWSEISGLINTLVVEEYYYYNLQ